MDDANHRYLARTLKNRLGAGAVIGSFVGIGHPAAVEVMAWSGFEFVCVDTEHAALGPSEVEDLVRAADACGVPCIVRVFQTGPEIGRALDSGAAGVLVPRIESAEQARECVAAGRYPPTGARGAGIGRATRYGRSFADYLAGANDDVLIAIQIETAAGVDAVAEIAGVDGVDVIFVGAGDLSVSLGVPAWSDEHTAAVRHVLRAADGARVPTGIFCFAPEQVAEWEQAGVRFFLVGSDLGLLAAAGARAFAACRGGGS